MMKTLKILSTTLLALFAVTPSTATAEVKILSSIRPIYYLVEGISQGINDHDLLVTGKISPHDYQPKPSDIKKIRSADIIFRIDDEFQPRFSKLFAANGKKAKIIALTEIENIAKLANQEHRDEAHDEEKHHEEAEHHDEDEHHEDEAHGHEHGEFDKHIWLSPVNAIIISDLIALELAKIDPKNREKYQYNAKIQSENLQKLDQVMHQKLSQFKGLDFFSYHDAYNHFTTNFGLNHSVAITPNSHQISANKIDSVIKTAKQDNVKCIMLEPQLNSKLAATIIKAKPDIKTEIWDPLGFELELSANSYHILLKSMMNNLTKCLTD